MKFLPALLAMGISKYGVQQQQLFVFSIHSISDISGDEDALGEDS